MAPKIKIPVRRTGRALAHLHSKPSPHMRLVPRFAGTLRSPQIEMRSAHGWRQPELHFGEARTRFPASHEPPGGASREPCAHLRSKCAPRMGGGSRSFILARLELASRHPTNRLAALRGNPALTSDRNALRAWVEAAGASFWRGSNSLPGIPRTAWRRFAGTLRSPQIEMRSAHGWRQRVRETGLHCKK